MAFTTDIKVPHYLPLDLFLQRLAPAHSSSLQRLHNLLAAPSSTSPKSTTVHYNLVVIHPHSPPHSLHPMKILSLIPTMSSSVTCRPLQLSSDACSLTSSLSLHPNLLIQHSAHRSPSENESCHCLCSILQPCSTNLTFFFPFSCLISPFPSCFP